MNPEEKPRMKIKMENYQSKVHKEYIIEHLHKIAKKNKNPKFRFLLIYKQTS